MIWGKALAVPTTAEGNCEAMLYSGEGDSFYLLYRDGKMNTLYACDKHGKRQCGTPEAADATSLVTNGDKVYLISQFGRVCSIFSPTSAVTELIADALPKNGCLAIDKQNTVYLTDQGEDRVIRRYRQYSTPDGEIRTDASVRSIFLSEDSATVYALTDKGLFCPDSGRTVTCDVPVCPFRLNGGYCCDSRGVVYRFDGINGFRRLFVTGDASVCYADGWLYTVSDHTIMQWNMDMELTGTFQPSVQPACELVSGGNALAVLCGNELVICDASDFVPVGQDKASDQSSVSQVSHRTQDNSQSSERQSSQQSVNKPDSDGSEPHSSQVGKAAQAVPLKVSSERYHISGDVISDIPIGTTAAVLKQNLIYPDCEVSVLDYRENEFHSGTIGTGFCLIFRTAEEERRYYTVVYGDVTGEGSVNTSDITAAAKSSVGKQELSGLQQQAADVNRDGGFDLRDLYELQKAYYGHQKELPADIFCDK